jgi:hypothetical protein
LEAQWAREAAPCREAIVKAREELRAAFAVGSAWTTRNRTPPSSAASAQSRRPHGRSEPAAAGTGDEARRPARPRAHRPRPAGSASARHRGPSIPPCRVVVDARTTGGGVCAVGRRLGDRQPCRGGQGARNRRRRDRAWASTARRAALGHGRGPPTRAGGRRVRDPPDRRRRPPGHEPRPGRRACPGGAERRGGGRPGRGRPSRSASAPALPPAPGLRRARRTAWPVVRRAAARGGGARRQLPFDP